MTSVEFIIEKMQSAKWEYTPWPERNKIIAQAKEMHRQEIVNAYVAQMDCTDKQSMRDTLGEQYYNETFKTK